MAKLLKPMVVVLFLLSITSLVLGLMVFNEREQIKGRAERLEGAVVELAESLHYPDLNRAHLADYELMRSTLNRFNVHASIVWTDLQDREQDLANVRADLDQTRDELQTTSNRLQTAEQQADRARQEAEERTAEASRARQQVAQLESERTSLQGQVADFEARVARVEGEKLELEDTVEDLQRQIAQLDEMIFEETGAVETPVGLSGEILVVNADWNFVILNVGKEKGLSENTEMLVHRSDQLIGRVRVSNVKDTHAVAEILTDWQQAPLREGDHVLF